MAKISFKSKKIIVFDLDGTIVKLSADWIILRDILLEKYKDYYNKNCNVKRISTCLNEVVQKKDEEVLIDFFDAIREFELKNINEAQVIQETIFFINNKELFGVEKNAKFAILSLNTRNTIIKALELSGIANNIDYIVGREDVRRWKPAPDGLIEIQKYFGVSNDEMIFIGDLENDIQTGKNANVEAHLVDALINLVKKIRNNKNHS